MSYKIAIASGKGGTGKTTVSVNLFHHIQKKLGQSVLLVDCDVEEPNDAIFFSGAMCGQEKQIFQSIPQINNNCTYCRKCVGYCEFNAIVMIPPAGFAEVNANLCHSCGACLIACEENAIVEVFHPIGKVSFYEEKGETVLAEGRLQIGSAMQTMLIKELKNQVDEAYDVILYDAPPGTSCPVVETISDVDYVVLVTEPTPFGLHDLKLMSELMNEVVKPFGVIVNKSGLGNNDVYEFLENERIELIGEVPFNKEYAADYAKGNLFKSNSQSILESYDRLFNELKCKILKYEGDNHIKW